jgi:hypothetical protein
MRRTEKRYLTQLSAAISNIQATTWNIVADELALPAI